MKFHYLSRGGSVGVGVWGEFKKKDNSAQFKLELG